VTVNVERSGGTQHGITAKISVQQVRRRGTMAAKHGRDGTCQAGKKVQVYEHDATRIKEATGLRSSSDLQIVAKVEAQIHIHSLHFVG
jgi:hypothetical protein